MATGIAGRRRPGARRHRDPRGRVGSQTTPATMSATSSTGSVIEPRSVLTDATPLADPGRGGRRRAEPSHRAAARWPAGTARRPSPSCRPGASARWRAPPGRRPGRPARRRRSLGAAARGAVPGPELDQLGLAPAPAVRSRERRRARRPGRPARGGRSSSSGLAITASKPRSRPSQLTNVPARSSISETGQHDVGPLGDRGRPGLEADHEADLLQALEGRRGIDQVGRVDARHDQRGELGVGRRRSASRRRRGRPRSAASDAPGGRGVDPGGRVG